MYVCTNVCMYVPILILGMYLNLNVCMYRNVPILILGMYLNLNVCMYRNVCTNLNLIVNVCKAPPV